MTEWACRTYGYRPHEVVEEIPAVQVAMLYRCYAHGVAGLKSGTFLEDMLAFEMFGKKV